VFVPRVRPYDFVTSIMMLSSVCAVSLSKLSPHVQIHNSFLTCSNAKHVRALSMALDRIEFHGEQQTDDTS